MRNAEFRGVPVGSRFVFEEVLLVVGEHGIGGEGIAFVLSCVQSLVLALHEDYFVFKLHLYSLVVYIRYLFR